MFERFDSAFEPSSTTKEAMLYVRKEPILVGGIRHPGLFGLHGYTQDWVLIIVALILEMIGLAALILVSRQNGANPLTAFGAAGALFLADLLIAIFHHRFSAGLNAILEIESLLHNKGGGTMGNINVKLNADRIQRRRFVAFIFSTLLIVICVLKFMAFRSYYIAVYDQGELGLLLFVAITYLVTAIIHIKVTGYLLHALWASILHSRDVGKFKNSGGKFCSAVDHIIELPPKLDWDKPIVIGNHMIVKETRAGTSENIYLLKCFGLLMDSEIAEFGNKIHTADAKGAFILAALGLQLQLAAAGRDQK